MFEGAGRVRDRQPSPVYLPIRRLRKVQGRRGLQEGGGGRIDTPDDLAGELGRELTLMFSLLLNRNLHVFPDLPSQNSKVVLTTFTCRLGGPVETNFQQPPAVKVKYSDEVG